MRVVLLSHTGNDNYLSSLVGPEAGNVHEVSNDKPSNPQNSDYAELLMLPPVLWLLFPRPQMQVTSRGTGLRTKRMR